MPTVVADTHAVLWYLGAPNRLSVAAAHTMRGAEESGGGIGVSAISIVEVVYLVDKGKIELTALEGLLSALADLESGVEMVDINLEIASAVAQIPRDQVPDMPDRIIAATALALGLPLVTRDAKIRASTIQTIW